MSKNFEDLFSRLKEIPTKKVAVAVAQDEPVLEAIKKASELNVAKAILVGDKEKIQEIAKKIDLDLKGYEIMDVKDPKKATLEAVKLVSSGHADMLMKGLVDTATFLRSVLTVIRIILNIKVNPYMFKSKN